MAKKKKYDKEFLKGSCRSYNFGDDVVMYLSVNVEQLAAIQNENGYANLEIRERNGGEEDDFGNTHFMLIPLEPPAPYEGKKGGGKKGGGKAKPAPKPRRKADVDFDDDDDEDELPF